MKITVFGAGNLGLACSAVLAADHDVMLYTAKPHRDKEAFVLDYEGATRPPIEVKVTDDLQRACESKLLLCTYPAFLRQDFISKIEPLVKPGMMIGFVPGYGGVEYYCQEVIKSGGIIFGLQRVPYVSRSCWNERTASVLSAKATLYAAALPKKHTAAVAEMIEGLFDIPTVPMKEFLAVTLVPSNPLLHTSGAYGIFKDYQQGDTFSEQLMFYENWTDETSEFLLAYDSELQRICEKLAPLELEEVVSLREYYESPTPEAMTKKLQSISAFSVVKAPMAKLENGSYVPNWNDRMFIEDYPFGVAIIKDIALAVGVETPTIDTLLDFYSKNTGIAYFESDGKLGKDHLSSAIPRNYGLTTKDELINFYLS